MKQLQEFASVTCLELVLGHPGSVYFVASGGFHKIGGELICCVHRQFYGSCCYSKLSTGKALRPA